MKTPRTLIFLLLIFLLAAAVALYTVFRLPPSSQPAEKAILANNSKIHPVQKTPTLWRKPISATANKPTPLPRGWLLTDSNGLILSLTGKGDIQWQASYSNHAWQSSVIVDDATICAVTQKGQLVLFDATTGVIKWSAETEISCLHPPLVEIIDQQRVIILLSQEDGTLVCVNARDGALRWRSPATSRSDGPPIRSGNFIAYGNCDAAVHLFSITNGHLRGSIQLGDDEQVAGGLLSLSDGRLIVGTRSGKLAMLDTLRMMCISRVTVSDTEAFATPVQIGANRIFMPVSEGRMTFWKIEGDNLVADTVVQLASQFNETCVVDTIFWAVAQHSVYAVRITDPSQQVQFDLGDDIHGIAPGCFGKAVLIVDGELACVKGF